MNDNAMNSLIEVFSKDIIHMSAGETEELLEDPIRSDASCDTGHNVPNLIPNTTQNLIQSSCYGWDISGVFLPIL